MKVQVPTTWDEILFLERIEYSYHLPEALKQRCSYAINEAIENMSHACSDCGMVGHNKGHMECPCPNGVDA